MGNKLPKVRFNSAPTRPAQSAELCSSQTIEYASLVRALQGFMLSDKWPVSLKSLALLQFSLGLRISEVLNISVSDLKQLNYIRIHTLKHGKARIIYYFDQTGYLQNCRFLGCNPYILYNRFFIYRIYKQNGLSIRIGSNVNNSVTHAPRHFIAKQLFNDFNQLPEVSDFLRHSSSKSIHYYI